jgi:hypothetical protein
MLSARPPLLATCLAIATAGCGGGDDDGDGNDEVNCATETRDDEFVAGMAKPGDVWSFRLMDSAPAPPHKGDNDWSVRVEGDGGAGIEELTLTVTPFMPDDGHGTPIEPAISDEGGGDYSATPVNMWMPGLWQVTVEATDGEETDAAVFAFCVQG